MLVGAFAVSRLVAAAAGVRFDDSVLRGTRLTDKWQLLDVHLLRTDLIESVWHLNSQPPLYNLYGGLLLWLPTGLRHPFETACGLALGLVIVLCTYHLLLELTVPRGVALGVTLVGVVASPAYLLYENWLDYAEPTAALGTFAAWCLVRYLRTVGPGTGSGSSAATRAWCCSTARTRSSGCWSGSSSSWSSCAPGGDRSWPSPRCRCSSSPPGT